MAGSLTRGIIQTKALFRPQSLHPEAPGAREFPVLLRQSWIQDPNSPISDPRALFPPHETGSNVPDIYMADRRDFFCALA